MNYSYNPEADALYVQVIDGRHIDHTEELPDGIVADLAADGALLGIDVMAASHGWDTSALLEQFPLDERDADFLGQLSLISWPAMNRLPPSISAPNPAARDRVNVLA